MIPKKIHYCWFGRNPLPDIVEKCIASWQKFLPDYEIIRWDEDNYDVRKNNFVRQAYSHKKYAFVSDFARFDILQEHGGIYMDTDVELLQNLDKFLIYPCFTGFESPILVNPGVIIGAEKRSQLIGYMKSYYELNDGFNPDKIETVVSIMTDYLTSNGLKLNNKLQKIQDVTIFPTEYFAPLGFQTGKLNITDNTVSIHHYAGSWLSTRDKIKITLYRIFNNLLSDEIFTKVRGFFK